jgi:hypothetical protein
MKGLELLNLINIFTKPVQHFIVSYDIINLSIPYFNILK